MKAVAVFPATREVRLVELPEPPPPGPREVLLRVLEVGICGTDREIASFEYGQSPAGSDRLLLGHEALARVEESGPDVTAVRPGDLVVPTVRRPCPHRRCPACRAGRQDFCVTGDFLERGIKEADGFLQELVLEDVENLVPVPRKLAEVAVLAEPMSVAAKASEQVAQIQRRLPWERDRVRALALGAGPVGLLGAISMVVSGCETFVYSIEPATSDRAELTRSLGATYVSGKDVPLEELGGRCGPFDVVYEAVGIPSVAFGALAALGPNGLFVVTGVPALGGTAELPANAIMRDVVLGNQIVLGTVNASRGAFSLALHELEQAMFLFPDSVRALITARTPIEEAPDVVRRQGGIKQVIRVASAEAT